MKTNLQSFSTRLASLDQRKVQFIMFLLALAMFVIGAGAPGTTGTPGQ